MMVGASAAPPNMSFCPMRRGLVAALARRQDRLGAGEHPRAVGIERVECAGGRKALDHALVDRARINPRGEIGQRREQPLLARLDDQFDRLRADALQRRQRVIDGAVADLEGGAGAIDRGRLDLDAEPLRFGAKLRRACRYCSVSSVIDAARNSTG